MTEEKKRESDLEIRIHDLELRDLQHVERIKELEATIRHMKGHTLRSDAVSAINDLLAFAKRAVAQGYLVNADDAFGPSVAFLSRYGADVPAVEDSPKTKDIGPTEREHKLREELREITKSCVSSEVDLAVSKADLAAARAEIEVLNANNDQLVCALKEGGHRYPTSDQPRFIVHDRVASSGDWYDPTTARILHMDPAKAFALADEVSAARARIAELEEQAKDCADGSCEACSECVTQAKNALEYAHQHASLRTGELAAKNTLLMVKMGARAEVYRNRLSKVRAQHLSVVKVLAEALQAARVVVEHHVPASGDECDDESGICEVSTLEKIDDALSTINGGSDDD